MKIIYLTPLVAVVFALLMPADCWSQSAINEARVKAHSATQASAIGSEKRCFALMGEVVHPGVYELKADAPYLINIIRIAGGLTQKASGHLRIVRQGRAGQQTFYSPQQNLRLLPGDVVVADAKPNYQPKLQQLGHLNAPSTAAESSDEFVQLGFINLIDRPVVEKIPRRFATVPKILQLMGQPASLAEHVRVISSKQPSRNSGQLANCSILIFDKAIPKPGRLPLTSFTATHKEDEIAHAGPIGIDEPTPPNAELIAKEQPNPTDDDQPKLQQLPGPQLGPLLSSTGAAGQPAGTVEMLPPPGHENSHTPAAGGHLIAEHDLENLPSGTPPPLENLTQPSNIEYAKTAPAVPGQRFEDVAAMTDRNVQQSNSSQAMTWIFGLMLIVGGGILTWAVAPRKNSRFKRQSIETSQTLVDEVMQQEDVFQVQEKSLLERLIDDELPILTEKVLFAPLLNLFGRPTGAEKLRLDATHKIAAPHIKPQIPQPAESDAATTAATATAPGMRLDPPAQAEQAGRAAHIPAAPASGRSQLKEELTSFKDW